MKLHFHCADTEEARTVCAALETTHGKHSAQDADIIVPLGGDGTMLETLHKYHELEKPFFGINLGTVGFLLNPHTEKDLIKRLENAESFKIYPLRMTAHTVDGKEVEGLAFNEVALFRQTRHAAKIKILIDGKAPMDETLVCDGLMLSTPAGSTAYNLSAGGPIIPLGGNVLALTPVSPFRPRRWRGAQLPTKANVRFEIIEPAHRPVRAETDAAEVHNVAYVDIRQSRKNQVTLMFDPDHNLEERILKEQFFS